MLIAISTEQRLRGREDSKRHVVFLEMELAGTACCMYSKREQ